MIPYGRQDITQTDIDAVTEVLQSDFITQGPAINRFEEAVTNHCGAAGSVAMTSATAALHVAYMALGIGEGDVVWTVPNTFAATANAALYCGADVDFVDIDMSTRNMNVEALEKKLNVAEKNDRLPKLITPVHFAGLPCDMADISALARQHGIKVVEDASHAIGGSYGNRPIGACDHSDATIFSFHPVKIVTTGEGGMLTSADPETVARAALLRTHGVTRDPALMTGEPDGPWYYEMISLGYNYRMTDIQAALGASQMTRLESIIERRHAIADRYDAALVDTGLGLPERPQGSRSGLHLYTVHWPEGLGGIDRRQAFDALREAGVGVNVHYIPVHLLPFYRARGFEPGDFPVAEAHYAQTISLPMFPTLTEQQQDHVVTTLRRLTCA